MAKKRRVNPLLSAMLLKPLSVAYGAVTGARNKMFDLGLMAQREFDIPVVVVGNIAVGGTGKTPHTEYLVDLLRYRFHIAVLSRGYNRRTHGFVLASPRTGARDIGDEPYQIYRKFGKDVLVAVCEDRCKGIDEIRKIDPAVNLIILDDAFQHRHVKPTVSIVLTEHSHPVFKDSMLPAGRLRESPSALKRADIVIVTKCPPDMNPLDYRLFVKHLNMFPWQKLYFTKYTYGTPQAVFADKAGTPPFFNALTPDDSIVALAGVANPTPFIKYLRGYRAKVKTLLFPDHHNFDRQDIRRLVDRVRSMPDPERTYVITTEKDAMRLRALASVPAALAARLFYIPIKVEFIPNPTSGAAGNDDFENNLLTTIARNSKQSR